MRCPRAEETHLKRSGGDGAPPGGNKTSRKELADGERYPFTLERISRQKRGPASEDTAMERRGAQAFSDRKEGPCTARCTLWALRGAPFPRHVRRGKGTRRDPRRLKNRASGALAV